MSLDQAIDAYLDHVATERGLAQKTVEAYARDLGAFTRFLVARGVRSAARIGATEVRAHLAALAEHGLSARSQARALAAARGFTRFLVLRGVLADDVLRHLHIRRPPARLPRALGTGEMGSLLAEPAESHCRGLRDRALLELLYACGLRVSEAISLRGAQVNLPAGFVTVLGKGGKERVVPLGRHARAALHRADAARARGHRDDADLHARGAEPAAGGAPAAPSAGVTLRARPARGTLRVPTIVVMEIVPLEHAADRPSATHLLGSSLPHRGD